MGDRCRDCGDVAHLPREVSCHRVHAVGQIFPRARHSLHIGLPAQLAFRSDLSGDTGDFRAERPQLIDHRVDGVFELQDLAAHIDGDLPREVAFGHGGRDLGDVPHLRREVSRHRVHAVRQILPGTSPALDGGLTA